MERDPKLLKLIRESGLTQAPVNFTDQVMGMITKEPAKRMYKPLIGRGGKIFVVLLIIAVVVVSLVNSEPGGLLFENAGGLSSIEWQLPQVDLSFDFLSEINISTWLVSTVVALFLLILADAGFNRRRRLA